MPRPRLPHLHRQVTRHGRTVWYVRIDKGQRIRLTAPFGSDAFTEQYRLAVLGTAPADTARARQPSKGSLAWLWKQYRATGAWTDLSMATRRQRENLMLHTLKASGDKPYEDIQRTHIAEGRDARATTPAQARNWLDMIRGLFAWAAEAQLVAVDPTIGVKNPKRNRAKEGFKPWTEADAAAYMTMYPLGTKERVWFDVLCFTGTRRGDAVMLGKQHIKKTKEGEFLTFRTEKSGEQVEVTIPLLPELALSLKAGPTSDLAFICGDRGHPMVKESFGGAFSEAARKAGVKKSAHGVRKIAATRAADNGATVHQLMAIFGWTDPKMAMLYTKEADRRRASITAGHMLVSSTAQSA